MGGKPRPASRATMTRLTDKLDRLRALDPTLQIHGASEHRCVVGPVVDAAVLAAFERKERVRLPAGYRLFLRCVQRAGDDAWARELSARCRAALAAARE